MEQALCPRPAVACYFLSTSIGSQAGLWWKIDARASRSRSM